MNLRFRILIAAIAWLLLVGHAEAKPGTYTLKEKCAHPELFLSSVPVDKIPEFMRQKCPARDHTPTMENLLQWSCEYRDFYRNAIYASYGRKFRKKKWKGLFKLALWYKHDPNYSDTNLSSMARTNIRKLRKPCVQTARDRRDKQLLQKWILALQRGNHKAASNMMTFPFHAAGEIASSCERLNSGGKTVTGCFDGFEDAVKDMAPAWLKGDNAIFENRADDSDGLFDFETRQVSLQGLRSFKVTWIPGNLACVVGVNPRYNERFIEDCGAVGMSTTIYIRGNRIAAAHFNGGSACPYVYVAKDGKFTFQGEILRNVVGPRMYRSQTLPIEIDPSDEVIEVIVTEEKDERTYLDSVSLLVDGKRLSPSQCVNKPNTRYCAANHNYETLDKGERLSLRFRIPATLNRANTELEMTGFYIPTPRSSQSGTLAPP